MARSTKVGSLLVFLDRTMAGNSESPSAFTVWFANETGRRPTKNCQGRHIPDLSTSDSQEQWLAKFRTVVMLVTTKDTMHSFGNGREH